MRRSTRATCSRAIGSAASPAAAPCRSPSCPTCCSRPSAACGRACETAAKDKPLVPINIDCEQEQRIRARPEMVDIPTIVDFIVHTAFEQGASDIHVEPVEDSTVVRVRIDGMLHEECRMPMRAASGDHVADQGSGRDGRGRAPAAAGRAHQCADPPHAARHPRLELAHRPRREDRHAPARREGACARRRSSSACATACCGCCSTRSPRRTASSC